MQSKEKRSGGFSLIELIVVIAIMAVLIGTLAPAYLRFLEKSKVQKAVANTKYVVDAITVVLTDTQANQSSEYEQLMQRLTTDEGSVTLENPYTVYLRDDDAFGKLILENLSSDNQISGSVKFYFDSSENIAFQLQTDQSDYVVDYNRVDPDTEYEWEDEKYHVAQKKES